MRRLAVTLTVLAALGVVLVWYRSDESPISFGLGSGPQATFDPVAGEASSSPANIGAGSPAIPPAGSAGADHGLPTLPDGAWEPVGPTSVVAEAVVPTVPVFAAPHAAGPSSSLQHPQPSGAPLVLLVRGQQDGWLQVLLPVRPNGTMGWVRRADVSLTQHDFRIVVELGAHSLRVYQGDQVIHEEPVGVGTRDAPTPGGLYFTKELIQPVDENGAYDPGGPYGPYAYGLSGFSNVFTSFAGGDGALGIHGTNDPSGLGRDVSHGCIRMSNDGITKLAGLLPLGVPVEVRP